MLTVSNFCVVCFNYFIVYHDVAHDSGVLVRVSRLAQALSDAFVRIPTYVALSWRENMSVPAITELGASEQRHHSQNQTYLHLDSVLRFGIGRYFLGILPTDTGGKLGKDFSVLCIWPERTHQRSNISNGGRVGPACASTQKSQ